MAPEELRFPKPFYVHGHRKWSKSSVDEYAYRLAGLEPPEEVKAPKSPIIVGAEYVCKVLGFSLSTLQRRLREECYDEAEAA